jgi:hypothetical protein
MEAKAADIWVLRDEAILQGVRAQGHSLMFMLTLTYGECLHSQVTLRNGISGAVTKFPELGPCMGQAGCSSTPTPVNGTYCLCETSIDEPRLHYNPRTVVPLSLNAWFIGRLQPALSAEYFTAIRLFSLFHK